MNPGGYRGNMNYNRGGTYRRNYNNRNYNSNSTGIPQQNKPEQSEPAPAEAAGKRLLYFDFLLIVEPVKPLAQLI